MIGDKDAFGYTQHPVSFSVNLLLPSIAPDGEGSAAGRKNSQLAAAQRLIVKHALAGPWRIPPLVVAKGLSGAFSLKEFIESPNAAPNFAQKVFFI